MVAAPSGPGDVVFTLLPGANVILGPLGPGVLIITIPDPPPPEYPDGLFPPAPPPT